MSGRRVCRTISGSVGEAGVKIQTSRRRTHLTVSDESGNYSIKVPRGWSGVITPTKDGVEFDPLSITYTNVRVDTASQDYSGGGGAPEEVTYTDGYGGDVNTAEDSLMASSWHTRNGGTHQNAEMSWNGSQKFLIRFDLSAIPSTATCESATLYVYHSTAPEGGNTTTINAYSVSSANSDWIEGTGNIEIALAGEPCWDAKEADGSEGVTTAWAGSAGMSTSGTDYESTSLGSTTVNPASAQGTESTMSLSTSRVEDWFGATNTNYGIVLIGSGGPGAPHIGSSDNITSGYRPKLVVVYTT